MKRTLTINLSGRQFVIDDDAYTMLSEYFTALEHLFSAHGEREVLEDIEGRMAEIFIEQMASPESIITISDVEKGIARIGKPEDFIEETTEHEYAGSPTGETIEIETERVKINTSTPPPPPLNNAPKRFYRDTRDKILGGVCSGIAWYIGCDPVWVRLATVALCFASLSIVALFYLVLWIIIPAATTPYERLQMMGKSPSVQNIGQIVTDDFDVSGEVSPTPEKRSVGRSIVEIIGWIAKVLIIMICVVLCPVVIGIALGLIGCVFAVIGFSIPGITHGNFNVSEIESIRSSIWCGIGWLITIGIPLSFGLYKLFGVVTKREMRVSKSAMISGLIIWIVGAALATIMTIKVSQMNCSTHQDYRQERIEHVRKKIQNMAEEVIEEVKEEVAEEVTEAISLNVEA